MCYRDRDDRLAHGLRMLRCLLAFVMLGVLGFGSAGAEQRIALVVGNGSYGAIGALPNPPADARLMAASLRRLGFKVTLLVDVDQAAMKRSILTFGRSLRGASRDAVGLFYYAGHGIQASGQNYLIPVRVNLQHEADLEVEAVEANWVLRQMESAGNATNIIILDACRNNPFARSFRSATRGLAQMDAPTGSFIAYATAPGDVAVDGVGRNSPYTEAIVAALDRPPEPIEQMFKRVRIDVLNETGGLQTPWDSSSLISDFYFRDPADDAPSDAAERQLWEAIKASRNVKQIELFLSVYGSGPHAEEARALLNDLKADAEAAPPEADAGTPEAETPEAATPQAGSPEADAPEAAPTAQGLHAPVPAPEQTPAAEPEPDPEAAASREEALGLTRRDIREIQRRLTLLELDPKGVDGILGPGSRKAIGLWQALNDLDETGFLDSDQIALLREQTEDAYAKWRRTAASRANSSGRTQGGGVSSGSGGNYIDGNGCLRNARGEIIPGFRLACERM